MPRGGIDPDESSQDAAKREMLEETGYSIDTLSYLGAIPMDSSLCSQFFHVYFAKAVELSATDREDGEVIAAIMALSKQEVKEALCKGQMELEVNGRKITAFCRDYHIAYAILLAETRGLL